MQGEDEAVSPVIATVLLLAITVMLSSMVFVLMSSSLSTVEKQPPNAKVSVRALSNGFHVVKITQLDQQLDPSKIEWSLQSPTQNQSLRGLTNDGDVYGKIGTNISFHDRDAGWSVSTGDYFVINCEKLGCDDGTWKFRLIDRGSNNVMTDVALPALYD